MPHRVEPYFAHVCNSRIQLERMFIPDICREIRIRSRERATQKMLFQRVQFQQFPRGGILPDTPLAPRSSCLRRSHPLVFMNPVLFKCSENPLELCEMNRACHCKEHKN